MVYLCLQRLQESYKYTIISTLSDVGRLYLCGAWWIRTGRGGRGTKCRPPVASRAGEDHRHRRHGEKDTTYCHTLHTIHTAPPSVSIRAGKFHKVVSRD